MQTFVPYSSFLRSMQTLDPTRLGNQVYREGMTLLRGGWPDHPAAKMWKGHRAALAEYLWTGFWVLKHERNRDYTDRPWVHEIYEARMDEFIMPYWWGDERVHSSHRAALLAKDPEWYSRFGWKEKPDPDLNYYWP